MAEAHDDFAAVDAIDAESIGSPGDRTFRVRARRGDDSAALWVEKQQLEALAEAIPRLLEQLETPDQHIDENAEEIAFFPDDPPIEFKVGRLALGYATADDRLVLMAHDLNTEEEDASIPPTFSCRFTRQQARVLSDACAEAVAGGRPLCVICHRPIDPDGHFCPRSNGHKEIQIPEEGA